MPIEINGQSPAQLRGTADGGVQKARAEDAGQRPAVGDSGPQDKVSLTDTAALLQRLSDRIAEQPAFDSQRVAAIREAIASGSYEIDPARVAEKMINFESALAEEA